MPQIDELKHQIAQLDELMRSGVLTTKAARVTRDRLEAELLALVGRPTGLDAAAAMGAATQPRPSTRLLLGVVAFVIVFGAGGYAWLGNHDGLSVGPVAAEAGAVGPAAAASAPHELGSAQIEGMIERLKERLKSKPDDAEGWAVLGRTYSALGRHAEALPIYRKVIELRPKEAQGYADLADAVGTSNGRTLEGEPEKLIAKALTLDPDNGKALALSGTVAFNRGDAQTAIKQWEHALRGVEPGGDMARQLQGALDEARQRMSLPAKPAPEGRAPAATSATASPMPAKADAGSTLQGRVTLSAKLKAMVSPEDTVFIFARSVQGGKAPLAILRKQVKDLPFDFTLDDSLAMSPAMSLSTVREAQVGARISKSGNAMPQPGDLQGLTAAIAVGSRGVALEIGEIVK